MNIERAGEPLLLRACKNGAFGKAYPYDGGCIYEAGFIYLAGTLRDEWLGALTERWKNRAFICLSEDWLDALTARKSEFQSAVRYQMHDFVPNRERLRTYRIGVSPAYRIDAFDEAAFFAHPFSQGAHYASFAEFARVGTGAVARFENEIVASASSYLSFRGHVEVDVSTQEAHRRKGLGLACAAMMLLDCVKRGITPHWDAQNPPSRGMAEKLGFQLQYEYVTFHATSHKSGASLEEH